MHLVHDHTYPAGQSADPTCACALRMHAIEGVGRKGKSQRRGTGHCRGGAQATAGILVGIRTFTFNAEAHFHPSKAPHALWEQLTTRCVPFAAATSVASQSEIRGSSHSGLHAHLLFQLRGRGALSGELSACARHGDHRRPGSALPVRSRCSPAAHSRAIAHSRCRPGLRRSSLSACTVSWIMRHHHACNAEEARQRVPAERRRGWPPPPCLLLATSAGNAGRI